MCSVRLGLGGQVGYRMKDAFDKSVSVGRTTRMLGLQWFWSPDLAGRQSSATNATYSVRVCLLLLPRSLALIVRAGFGLPWSRAPVPALCT